MIDALMNTYLFKEIDIADIEKITTFSQKLELIDGDVLISENEKAYDLYILCDGNVEIVSNGSASTTSDEIVLSKHDSEILGEISWLSHSKRTATVRCIGDVVVIRIDGDRFMEYLESHTKFGFTIMRNIAILLSERLSDTNGLLKQILWNIAL